MITNSTASEALHPIMQPFVDFWTEYAKQASESTREFLDGIDDQASLKTFRRRWLDAVSKSADAYLRSPIFLQAMRRGNDAVVKLKRQSDDVTSELARNANVATAGDISGLFERLHSIEESILSKLGRIEERLDAMEEKIGSGELVKS